MRRSFRTDRAAKRRRRILSALLLAAIVFYSLALSQGWLDREPPQLIADVPERGAAGQTVTLRVSSSEPVVFTLSVNGAVSEHVTQILDLPVPLQPGENAIRISATDGASNVAEELLTVRGVPAAEVTLAAPETAQAGDPLGMQLHFRAEPAITHVDVRVGGEPLRVFLSQTRAVALGAVALGSATQALPLEVALTDEFGRVRRLSRNLHVEADAREVELLNLSPEVLSSSTPENKMLEAEALEAAYAQATPQPLWREPFLMPVKGASTSSFGSARQYGVGGNISYHQGADFGAPEGTPIYATNDGIVRLADHYPIKGGLVMIDHGAGVHSLYFHQSRVIARVGQRVARGEKIGEVGSTGLSTGPHLHWEMRVNEVATRPLTWVGKVLP